MHINRLSVQIDLQWLACCKWGETTSDLLFTGKIFDEHMPRVTEELTGGAICAGPSAN